MAAQTDNDEGIGKQKYANNIYILFIEHYRSSMQANKISGAVDFRYTENLGMRNTVRESVRV